jgi:hypothetical protein
VGIVASSHAMLPRQAATMTIARMLRFIRTSSARGVVSRHQFFPRQRAMRQFVVVT